MKRALFYATKNDHQKNIGHIVTRDGKLVGAGVGVGILRKHFADVKGVEVDAAFLRMQSMFDSPYLRCVVDDLELAPDSGAGAPQRSGVDASQPSGKADASLSGVPDGSSTRSYPGPDHQGLPGVWGGSRKRSGAGGALAKPKPEHKPYLLDKDAQMGVQEDVVLLLKAREDIDAEIVYGEHWTPDMMKKYRLVNEDMLAVMAHLEEYRAEVSVDFVEQKFPGQNRDELNSLKIEIKWFDQSDQEVGLAIYELREDAERAYLSWLGFHEGWQDLDLGTKVFHRQVEVLRAMGYKDMEFFADATIGQYAWAREGAEYLSGWNLGKNDRLERWASRMVSDGHLPKGALDEVKAATFGSLYNLASYRSPTGIKISSEHIVMHGLNVGSYGNPYPEPVDVHLGKAFMLGDGYPAHGAWDAKIVLNKRRG